MQKQLHWEIVVSNVGTVWRVGGRDVEDLADSVFRNYVELSKAPFGRASSEEVTLLLNGSVVYWYNPENQSITCC